jgi:hypothetical protein
MLLSGILDSCFVLSDDRYKKKEEKGGKKKMIIGC